MASAFQVKGPFTAHIADGSVVDTDNPRPHHPLSDHDKETISEIDPPLEEEEFNIIVPEKCCPGGYELDGVNT